MTKKLLVVEDDSHIRELLRLYLEREGYEVIQASDGEAGLDAFRRENPCLVLLDLMMPKKDGFEVCREIRQESRVPIIMLTAKNEMYDKVMGLDLGADDYIAKPLEMREVLARIRAVLRRSEPTEQRKVLTFDHLTVDKEAYELILGGVQVDAPPKEIELLYFLAASPNRVFTRAQLLDEVWGFDYFGDTRTVDVHIKRLRKKLEGLSDQWELKTVWGVGYKFELRESGAEEK